jgi:hypothetical protein
MDLSRFEKFAFPVEPGIVYMIGVCFDSTGFEDKRFAPFYVGQSSTRHIGRLGDYVSGRLTASTDFRIRKTVVSLQEKSFKVWFVYRASGDPKKEEGALKAQAEADGCLLIPRRTRGIKEIRDFVSDFVERRGMRGGLENEC